MHHCFDANDALSKYALDNNVQFFLCQYPYTSGGRVAGVFPDWLSFPSLNNTAVIFCTIRAMNCVISLRTANSIFITVVFKQISIVLRSVYSAPSCDIDADMSGWINHFMTCDKLLVGGDFKVPLLSFGYTREDERSEVFQDYLMISNLRILNDPGAPQSYVQDERKGRPDLTLADVDVFQFLDGWSVDDRTFSFSDHSFEDFPEEIRRHSILSEIYRQCSIRKLCLFFIMI